ncbi:MAG: ABC transporter permease [Ornithinimicrobium sp.]|uniref:ABC transporter permease n=1 Tax=Ornithinimicrobium sp. TaxID=1977084 RepID=UPI0026E0C200|nr:ABC transporter permease [Ornithinimicrobium sp.]MDO5739870.1 ABC transporter permease [Ornithinimicrobium sp.]
MTTWAGWAVHRARASTGLLLTLLALVTVTTAILAGAVGYSGAAATTAARQALTGVAPEEAGIRVQTRQSADPAAQDTAAVQRIESAFAPAPVVVQRTVASEPRSVTLDGATLQGKLVVVSSPALTPSDPAFDDRVQIVEGAWATSTATKPIQGVLHAAAATEWGVSVGDTLRVDGVPATIVGVWRPVDAADAYWFGDRLVAAGKDDAERGPLVVAPGAVSMIVEAPFVRWTVQPQTDTIQPDDLVHLAAAAADLRESLKTAAVDVRGVTVDGDLAPTAALAATNLATARALGVIPLSVLALVTVLAITQLARLLATTREAQSQLLLARGATRTQVLAGTLTESAVVTVLGITFGAVLAVRVLQSIPAGDAQGLTVVQVATLTGLVILAVLAVVATSQVRRLTTGGSADLSGRTKAATTLATVVLVLGSAAIAWWQLRRTGSPLITRDDGTLGTDLVSGAAPALLLAATAVVAMALLGPVSALMEAATRRGRTAEGHLAAAQVSRRLPVYAVPAVLTVLAVGATTVSGLYAGTSTTLRDNLAAVAQGAPVRATMVEPPATTTPGTITPPPPTYADLRGIERSTLVWLDPNARIGDVSVPITVGSSRDLAQIATAPDLPDNLLPGPGTLVPPDALAPEAAPPVGLSLPEGTRTVTVAVDTKVTTAESGLSALQDYFEQTVKDATDPPPEWESDPLPEAEAISAAREMLDTALSQSLAEPEFTVTMTLTFIDPDNATLDAVSSSLTVRRVTVQPPPPEVEKVDYRTSTVVQGGGSGTLTYILPPDTRQVLHSVRLEIPAVPENRWDPIQSDLALTLRAVTDTGAHVFGSPTADWGAVEAASEDVVAKARAQAAAGGSPQQITVIDPQTGGVFTSEGTIFIPALLDTAGTTWRLQGSPQTNLAREVTVGPGLQYVDRSRPPGSGPRGGTGADVDKASDGAVPLALTPEAAAAANLQVGEATTIEAFGSTIPVTVAALVPAVPGRLDPLAGLLDRDATAASLAIDGRSLPYPSQVWAIPVPGQEVAVVEDLAGQPGISAVTGPGAVSITDATSAARLVFWVASAGAVLLAITGIAAVAATLLVHRRPEVAVLRALGMPPRAQARSRAVELGGVVLASILLGLGAGWLVGRAVVPELARSTTLRDQVHLPAQLLLEPGPWAVLLVAGIGLVLVIVVAQASQVTRQAVDNTYREEIR